MDQTSNSTVNNNAPKSVLLIEDEFYIRDIYKGVLQNAGINVIEATNGQEGLEKAYIIPNLILLDIMLPGINGLDILKRLKSDLKTQAVPIILITNLGQQDIIKEAFSLGAQGYLLKVRVNPKVLVEQVNIFLSNPNYKMDINTLPFD